MYVRAYIINKCIYTRIICFWWAFRWAATHTRESSNACICICQLNGNFHRVYFNFSSTLLRTRRKYITHMWVFQYVCLQFYKLHPFTHPPSNNIDFCSQWAFEQKILYWNTHHGSFLFECTTWVRTVLEHLQSCFICTTYTWCECMRILNKTFTYANLFCTFFSTNETDI